MGTFGLDHQRKLDGVGKFHSEKVSNVSMSVIKDIQSTETDIYNDPYGV